ncbi:DUF434 domain-containing protein [Chryseobacterium sp. MYb264]|uniref:DUF434 domain-containing protein n=1 Tax=Chryseobacterium sp. MYb264 TaxID=2745153 RepID=UPI002E103BEA|nr:DUF434 domain-containing protein [Chryseobacterium sp. MYb264]
MNNRNRGKNTGDDDLFGSEKQIEKLKKAVRDVKYLLSHGYAEKASCDLAGNRYRLKTRQIQAFRGAAASEAQIIERKAKELGASDLENKTVYLDGFNIVILLESLLSGAYIFQGLDGCYRDLSGVHGTYKRVNQTLEVIEMIGSLFQQLRLGKIIWIFDQPVSNSGRIKQMIEEFAQGKALNWEVYLEFNPDRFLVENAGIVVSSDAWILDNCGHWFNLAAYLIQNENRSANLIKLF